MMSQPKEFGTSESDPLNKHLKNIDQLIALFSNTERSLTDVKLGIEYEMFGQVKKSQTPLPYEGNVSITSLFLHLVGTSKTSIDPFTPVFEGENLVALSCKRAVIALEPGGQLEIAASPHRTLEDTITIFSDVVRDIKNAAADKGIDLFALGIHPSAQREDMAKVKKARYLIMRDYMGGLSGLGLDMMTRSCAIQLNLDYISEQDMVSKTRLAAALVPFYSLICASVAFVDKKPSTYAVERGHVWRKTDPDRTGIPAIIFQKDFGYRAWINMVLDVPMYFLRRNKTYIDVAGTSFRDFIAHGLRGYQATERDFIDHMSTVFTEIRLKPILELRSADSLPVPFVNALTALTWALFYDDECHNRANEIFADLTHSELISLHNDVIDIGQKAQFRRSGIFTTMKKLLSCAQDALDRLDQDYWASVLMPFYCLVEQDITCADWIKKHFRQLSPHDLSSLIKSFDPFHNPLSC
jgi:glutamate--cysteine ligase